MGEIDCHENNETTESRRHSLREPVRIRRICKPSRRPDEDCRAVGGVEHQRHCGDARPCIEKQNNAFMDDDTSDLLGCMQEQAAVVKHDVKDNKVPE